MALTIVIIDRNIIDSRYANNPEDGKGFYTYGFGSLYARQLKKHQPEINVECWKADPRIKSLQAEKIQDVFYRIFPSIEFKKIGQYSASMIRFLKAWKKQNPETVYFLNSFNHLLFYSLAPHLKKVPLVVQNHGESTAKYKVATKKGIKKLSWIIRMPIEKRCFKSIDLLFILDERLHKWLPQNAKQPVIIQSTVGVDDSVVISLDKKVSKSILGLDQSKKHLLYIGRLNYTKRPDILIDIYNELKLERSDVDLILAGHETSDPLVQRAKDSGALMFGPIMHTEIYLYLSAADIYLLPDYTDNHTFGGIGLLPVEAIMCNTPVVGGSLRNFPKNDRHFVGIYASKQDDIKDAIKSILDGKMKFGETRQYAIRHYSWENVCARVVKHFYHLASCYR